MKKFLISGIIATAAFFAVSPAWAYYPIQGDLIKASGNPAVYYVDGNGYRHLFPTEATFFTWYAGSWRDQSIKTISSSEFSQIASGKNVTARPGSNLLRFENSLVMYAILPDARLCHAPAHYGNYQYNRALVIPVGFQVDYNADSNCDITQSVNLPEGTLLRYVNSNDIYYIQNGQRRHITTNGMTANRFRYESVVSNVDWSMSYPEGAILDGYDSSISDLNSYLYDYGNNNYNYNNSYNYLCSENWTCGAWSSCAYGKSYRTCWDQNLCGTAISKPIESQTCYTCQENWITSSWGACQTSGLSNGWQFRTVTDLNACGTTKNKPSTNQACTAACSTNWSCTAWTTCSGNYQSRSCIDLNNCNSTTGKPITSQSCR
ncbi:MAG: hypothetical protein WCT26_03720 [Candidatus Buchananbacteria bacterium]|jgi:hypothetical protein